MLIWQAVTNVACGSGEVDTERALQSLSRARWFDVETSTYVPPEIRPLRDNALRSGGYVAAVKVKPNKTPWNLTPFWNFLSYLFSWGTLGFLSVAILLTIFGLVVYALRNKSFEARQNMPKKAKIIVDPARVSELPFQVDARATDPLSRAEQLRNAGRYDEAIVFLYGYMLLALDHARRLHLQKGKTNRMYLRELKSGELRRISEFSMLAFEEVFFGKRGLSKERFELAWTQLDEFHRLLAATESPQLAPATRGVSTA